LEVLYGALSGAEAEEDRLLDGAILRVTSMVHAPGR
jgi:hypothetical protein